MRFGKSISVIGLISSLLLVGCGIQNIQAPMPSNDNPTLEVSSAVSIHYDDSLYLIKDVTNIAPKTPLKEEKSETVAPKEVVKTPEKADNIKNIQKKTITLIPVTKMPSIADCPSKTQKLVNEIFGAVKQNKQISIKADIMETEEAIEAIEKIYYPYTHGGSGLHATKMKDGIFITFHSHANTLYQKNQYVDKRIKEVCSMIFKKGMSEDEAVKRINDWIINAVDYERETRDLYSLFAHHKGNCESFSNIFEYFCNYAGIECMSVVGEAGEGHEWNKVKVNGEWFYIDVTFNQNTDNKYYLSKELWPDHKVLLEYKVFDA